MEINVVTNILMGAYEIKIVVRARFEDVSATISLVLIYITVHSKFLSS